MKDNTHDGTVAIPIGRCSLVGDVVMPGGGAQRVVLFAHGSGSSRFSPRNRSVARALHTDGLATLLVDLLTPEEEEVDRLTGQFRFNISLLAERLFGVTDWLLKNSGTKGMSIGYFGASTGAGAALIAAAERPAAIGAVVSRGGRPDMAGPSLRRVQAPTLLVVGGEDHQVIDLNREAFAQLACEKKLEIIPRATHLFEEPGTLEEVSRLAGIWFVSHLATPQP